MKKRYIHCFLYPLDLFCVGITCFVYARLPNQIPIHFDMMGVVDSYGPKPMIFLMPALMFAILIMGEVLPYMDPHGKNYERFKKSYQLFYTVIIIALAVFHFFILAVSLQYKIVNIANLMPTFIGILFLFLGNIMPRFRHNYFIGIKTVWAINDIDNWNKTQRFGGKMMILAGVVILLMDFMDRRWQSIVLMGILGMIVILPTVYSYVVFLKKKRGNENDATNN